MPPLLFGFWVVGGRFPLVGNRHLALFDVGSGLNAASDHQNLPLSTSPNAKTPFLHPFCLFFPLALPSPTRHPSLFFAFLPIIDSFCARAPLPHRLMYHPF